MDYRPRELYFSRLIEGREMLNLRLGIVRLLPSQFTVLSPD
jgi:hypothetical protein